METIVLNMRWAGYLLFAIGLINWRYQNSFEKGAPLWMFGLALIIGTYIPAVSQVITTKVGATVIAVIVALLLMVAFFA
jgi:VIT1/CCC1 family predicted Fe2+/Mn2+ transporter